MDHALARTFLAIVESGSFVAASRRLHVTQSTVSVRVRNLESLLGKRLFERSNARCELTPAGRQFHRYAQSLVQVWEEARHQVAVPESYTETLALGGQYSLWEGLLFDWFDRCRCELPSTALRLTAGAPRRLLSELQEGKLDVAVVHEAELRPGVRVETLFEDHLTLVTAEPGADFRSRYVFVDWGESFRIMHADAFPEVHSPGLTVEIGSLALDILLRERAAGYFPERLVRPLLADGRLHRVADAPVFLYPAFVVYPQPGDARGSLARCIELLREVTSAVEPGFAAP